MDGHVICGRETTLGGLDGWMQGDVKDGGKEREDREGIRAISLHPSGTAIKGEREVMDGVISWGER